MHAPLASPKAAAPAGFGWLAIVRIGLVQAAIGALVMLATTVLNRVMVVELGLLAAIRHRSGAALLWRCWLTA